MATVEVFTVGGGPYLVNAFNAIAAWTSADGYRGLLQVVGVIAFGWALASMALTQNWRSFLRWFLGFVAIYTMFLLPRTEVKITDRLNPAVVGATVANVPTSVAVLASFSSQVGDYLTRTSEVVFGLPQDLRYSTNGMVYGGKLLESARSIRISNPEFAANLDAFARQCVFYDILLRKYALDALVKSPNIWSFLGAHNPSPVRMMTYTSVGASPVTATIVTCKQAYDAMTLLWADVNSPIQVAALQLGRKHFPDLADAAAKARIISDLPIAHSYILSGTRAASDIFQQTLLANAFAQATTSFAGTGGQIDVLAQTRADIQTESTYRAVARQAEMYVPLLRIVLEVLFYALFPVIFPLFLLPAGIGVLEGYAKGFFYLQAWGPVYVVLHSIMTWTLRAQGMAEARDTGTFTMASMAGIGDINNGVSSVAGFLMMSVPFIAAGLARGAMAISSQAVSYLAPSQQAAEAGAAAAATGNIQLDNTSVGTHAYNNFTANKWSTAGEFATGASAFRVQQDDGSVVSAFGRGAVVDTRGARSSFSITPTLSRALNHEQTMAAHTSFANAQRLANSASSSFNAARTEGRNLMDAARASLSTDSASGVESNQAVREGFSQMNRAAENLQSIYGFSREKALDWVSRAYLGIEGHAKGGLPLAGLTGVDVGVTGKAGLEGQRNQRTTASASANDTAAMTMLDEFARDNHWDRSAAAFLRATSTSSDGRVRELTRTVQTHLAQGHSFAAESQRSFEVARRLEEAVSERGASGVSASQEMSQALLRFAEREVAQNRAMLGDFNPHVGAHWEAPSGSSVGMIRDGIVQAFIASEVDRMRQAVGADQSSGALQPQLTRIAPPSAAELMRPQIGAAADINRIGARDLQLLDAQVPGPVAAMTDADIQAGRAATHGAVERGSVTVLGQVANRARVVQGQTGRIVSDPQVTYRNYEDD